MLKKTIKFTDFNGDEAEEDHYFHLSSAELVELEMSVKGGMKEMLKRVIAANDAATIINEFKKIILMSYGKRSEDGRRFIKNQELRDEFESSEAYSALFMELVTDTNAAIEFTNGIIPKDLAEKAEKLKQGESRGNAADLDEGRKVKDVTQAELENMNREEFTQFQNDLKNGSVRVIDNPPGLVKIVDNPPDKEISKF